MALHFHKTPIVYSASTLKDLVSRYKEYTAKTDYPAVDEENYEKCRLTIALLHSGIRQIKEGRENLQKLYDEIREEYKNCKNKSEKKDLMTEIEQIEEESQLQVSMAEANNLIFMLTARLDESKCARDRMDLKLGYVNQRSRNEHTILEETEPQNERNNDSEQNEVQNNSESGNSHASSSNSSTLDQNLSNSSHYRSIKPPQASLPKFHGNAEEFSEYWAVFETLVHKSKELDIMEKILLLKESLRGRAQTAIRGIKLVPENYNWIIETLQRTYCNHSTNRAQIVQKLVNMRPATNSADSCSSVFDQIQVLVNQMISAGYDVRTTCDPIWCETILAKFPQDIVKPVLMTGQMIDDQKIETLLTHLKREITAKGYVENRLYHANSARVNTSKDKGINQRPYSNEWCLFCHKGNHPPMSCRTITDQSTRRKVMKSENRCWKCCSPNHNSFECQKPDCSHCGQKHHTSLCLKGNVTQQRNQVPSWSTNQRNTTGQNNARLPYQPNRDQRIPSNQNDRRRITSNNTHTGGKITCPQIGSSASQLVLMTTEGNVWNCNKKEYEKVLFFFDSGAQKTVIEESLAERLGLLKQTTEVCTMSGIGGHIECFKSHIVNVKISTAFGEEVDLKIQTKPVITNGFPSVNLNSADITFLKENNICLANSKLRGEYQTPSILVGLDYYHELVTGLSHTIRTPTGLQITRTVFGPTVYGKGAIRAESTQNTMCYGLTAVHEDSEQEILRKMFELEGLGISTQECQKDDKIHKYLEDYSKKISFHHGRIIAPFPLKANIPHLEDNYAVAIRRLESLQRILQQNRNQCEWYCKILKNYEQEEIIEPFSDSVENAVGTYYMPHSGVWKTSKKVPLRIVFDASSSRKGKLSLNDVIERGESFTNKIHDILISSRNCKIILLCDIEAAFTQIHLVNSNKDLCRFLWLKNVNLPPTKDNLISYRFKRLPFGVTASPSILNMCITSFLNSEGTTLAAEIAKNLYVDNIMMVANTTEEAFQKYQQSKKLFAKIGMNLREYISNSPEVNGRIAAHDRLDHGPLKFLGVEYGIVEDTFKVTTQFHIMTKLTKKDIVSQINSTFDPIGLAGPLLVHLKSMMREVFESGADWTTTLDSVTCDKWNKLCKDVDNAMISIPRTTSHFANGGKNRLWIFADASKAAIATCAYLQCHATGSISTLISGKTKLTPKKGRQTIPRLELIGILMATRLSKSITSNISGHVEQISIVSDSEIALWWLKSSKRLPIFVANQRDRINTIKDQYEQDGIFLDFFHVDTAYNPADAGTRGLTAQQINNHDWVRGPRWLEKDPKTWPLRSMDKVKEVISTEERLDVVTSTNIADSCEPIDREQVNLIDLSAYSNLNRVLRIISLLGKTAKNWVTSTNKNRSTSITLHQVQNFDSQDEITSVDIDLSEEILIAQEQKGLELDELQKRFRDKKVIRDEKGILRHESRLQNAFVPTDTKSPIYIPAESELVRLILLKIHKDNAHCGKDHTLTLVRQRFWIPRVATKFKKHLQKCTTCKKYQGFPLGAPIMPPLPKDRVVSSKPFENTGSDFMGPFTSKTNEKMYVCLYTCLTTRAIHLEVVENLSTGAFLDSFVRFTSRRGIPKIMRSDCGSNFKNGERIIATMFEKDDVTGNSVMTYSASERIKWIFNPPASPWMGGAWERLVGCVKKALNKTIGRKKLSFPEMCTILTRIEAILNTRPLTKPDSDDVTKIPLRPIDFLQGNVRFSLPDGISQHDYNDLDYDPTLIQTEKQALEAIRFSERIADKFWESWKSHYLVSLREIQKSHYKQPRHLKRTDPEVGEIVLIEQDLVPRGNWPYGKVTEVIISADGLIRSAKILMPNHRVIQRPLNKIFPLEIHSPPENHSGSDANTSEPQTVTNKRQILNRVSKTRAYDIIRDFEQSLESSHISQTSSYMASPLVFMLIMCLISPGSATNVSSNILCANGVVKIISSGNPFELCFNSDCRTPSNYHENLTFALPISPINEKMGVRLRELNSNSTVEQFVVCDLPEFCDHQYFLAKSLLGNPSCWPAGAIVTLAVLIYFTTMTIIIVTCTVYKLSAKRNLSNIARPKRRSELKRTSESAGKFELVPLPGATSISICVLVCILSSGVNACQHGYMRHAADLVCDEKNSCHLEYNRELYFNKLQSELCIEIFHGNKTVGVAKFVKKHVVFHCSKVTESFTRMTTTRIYHAKRCAQAGSCSTHSCETIRPNDHIPELEKAANYPGYSGCFSSCGGLLCGCFLPQPACTFYKVAQKPLSKRVYEIVRCSSWKPTVHLEVNLDMFGDKKSINRSYKPYIPVAIHNFNVTVISIQKLANSIINQRFAVSTNTSFVLPEGFRIPVECSSSEQAKNNFASCVNRMRCDCVNSINNCICPEVSLSYLRNNSDAILPLETPLAKVEVLSNDIIAKSNEEELVIRIESKMLQNSAELLVNQQCTIRTSNLTGCYRCPHGADLALSCHSPTESVVTAICETLQFSFRCDSSNRENAILLSFEKSTIYEECVVHCAATPTTFFLSGRLNYHIQLPNASIFEHNSHAMSLRHQWFTDLSMPDLTPLINVVKQHWKTTVTAIAMTIGVSAITYIAGPLIIFYITKLTISLLSTVASVSCSCVFKIMSALCCHKMEVQKRTRNA